MENDETPSLDGLSEAERLRVLNRFQILRPFLEKEIPLAQIAKREGIPVRTAWSWVNRYRKEGLPGLARQVRRDKDQRQISSQLEHAIEGLALKKPRLSIASIQREVSAIAKKLGEHPPSYDVVYSIVRCLEPALVTLAHEGAKNYSDMYDLIHRTEAETPNAIWQVDHTQLDILINDNGQAKKPWLTIVLDDYSRAVAGYFLTFSAPSAIQTAPALRQAIWRKSEPGWHVCGIPEILYTDHGSDFTSKHIEQVAAELKIRLVFSAVGRPRGRGKIERFFKSLSQILLPGLPGFYPYGDKPKAVLTLTELGKELERYIIHTYHGTPHRTTGQAPQERWDAGGFLPQMPESLAQLDLLLLTVPKSRQVRQDGIHFSGMRYIDPTLAAYVGEKVVLRYDPRDMAEVRVFYNDRFLCRAICQELAGETVPLRDIVSARNRQRRELRQKIEDRTRTVDALLEARRWAVDPEEGEEPSLGKGRPAHNLKRYRND